jgi:hypothetical protein
VPGPPLNEPGVLTVKEVHTEFEKLLRDRRHMGLGNLIGDTFLEPRNPFQKKRQQPKRWVVAACGIALLGLLIFSYFHLR